MCIRDRFKPYGGFDIYQFFLKKFISQNPQTLIMASSMKMCIRDRLTEGGVISAVKSFYFLEEHDALGGLEKVGTMLDKARYSNSLSSKLTAHLQRINPVSYTHLCIICSDCSSIYFT